MNRQDFLNTTPEALAEQFPCECPAEVTGSGECPMNPPENCLDRTDDQGRLVECWAAVQHELQARRVT